MVLSLTFFNPNVRSGYGFLGSELRQAALGMTLFLARVPNGTTPAGRQQVARRSETFP